MPWIKKNLALVLGGLVGLILLGGSGFFLYSESNREADINVALEEKRNEWSRLNGLAPYPEDKNIKAVQEEAKRVAGVAEEVRGAIRPVDAPEVTDTYSLKLLIETTISDLHDAAEASGVRIPDRYAFTFQSLREMPQFNSNGIPQLAEQVGQITTICRILFDAKIHSLNTLRRSPVLKEEGGGSDYLTKKSVTNNWVVRTPFDLSFTSFSGELADVLRGFAELDQCVVIKTVNIEPTSLPPAGGAPTMTSAAALPTMSSSGPAGMDPALAQRYGLGAGGGAGGMDPALASRYGLGPGGRPGEGGGPGGAGMDAALRNRYGLGPGAGGPGGADQMRSRYGLGGGGMDPNLANRYGIGTPPVAPMPMAPAPSMVPGVAPRSSRPEVVLDERPLRIILQLDFVKPKPEPSSTSRTVVRRTVAPDDGAAATDPDSAQ